MIWKFCTRFGFAPVQAQQPVRDAVEGADPHAEPGHAEQLLDAAAHLARGLVRERHGEDAVRRGALDLDDPGDAVGEHARLAAAGAGQHEHGPERGGDRLALRVVQGIQNRGQIHEGAHCTCGPRRARAQPSDLNRLLVIPPEPSSSANWSRATISASTTGPISEPMKPNAATPPITPTNTVSVETAARCRVRYGRRKLSENPTPTLHTPGRWPSPTGP